MIQRRRIRVLVTGATGFVGRALAAALAADGVPLTLAVRAPAPPPPGARLVPVGDLAGGVDWGPALEDAGAVVHLAAHVHRAPERAEAEAERFDAVNHRATVRLFEEAARRGVRRFVFLSSVTVLGPGGPPGSPLDDASPPDPRTPYARSKLAAEGDLRERAGRVATELVVLRPPLVVGPGAGGNLDALARLADTPWPLPLGGLRNRRTALSLDNLVAAIRTVLRHPGPTGPSKPFALGDPEPVSPSDMVAALRRGLGRPVRLLPAPTGALAAAARLVGRPGLAERLLGDLVVDSSRFRRAFAFEDVTTSLASLEAAGRARRGMTGGRASC